ncbi:hypothetical protein ABZ669_39135 [Streptomyces hirsutus]|uniref:hypothetical protein n=1 Tax=Streptomyces hirsutus TaxID=35620 RepID=UPI0033CEB3FF
MFVRFSEDNGLIADPWLSGPGERLAEAQDRHDAYFRVNPSKNDRDWLLDSFDALAASHRTVAGLFDRTHNPLYEVTPSYEAATALLAFWRERGADGEIVHDFTDPELDTRSSATCTRTCRSTRGRRTRCSRRRCSWRSSSST